MEDCFFDLWDNVDESELEFEDKNIYHTDKYKAMELLGKVLAYNKSDSNIYRSIGEIDYLVKERLLDLSRKIEMEDESEVYSQLKALVSKLYELKMVKLLNNKSIVGIGGMFSAGKSKFINSVIEYDILPENQLPTTSIPTYISKGENRLSAYTYNNLDVDLDEDAVRAISHIFYEEYKISFTRYIKSIVIENHKYKYDNIVLLDTPGYTKADSHKKDDNTDESIAREHLKIVDYLIWLIDIDNGVIREDDIKFISTLNMDKPILIVFNKADKKSESDVEAILNNTKEILKNIGVNVYGVAAYSSVENREYHGNYINEFFENINKNSMNKNNLLLKFKELLKRYDHYFINKKSKLNEERYQILTLINKSTNLNQIHNLSQIYSEINGRIALNNARYKEFNDINMRLISEVEKIIHR